MWTGVGTAAQRPARHPPPRRAALERTKMPTISRAEDTVLIVKSECALFSTGASGDLRRPDHNQLSQLLHIWHAAATVPLGCGQLGAGVGRARTISIYPFTLAAYRSLDRTAAF